MKKIISNNGHILTDSNNIFTVETSEGGSVNVNVPGGWSGTTVPTSGYVENVYFNTNLSVEEVVSLCSKLKLSEDDISSYVMLIALTEPSIAIAIYKNTDGSYQISDIMNGNIYFHSSFSSEFINDFGFDTGWNPNFNGLISVNSDVFSGNEEEGYVGLQNDKLSSLFSTTPFVQASGESIGLSGEYDGTPIEVTENVDMKALLENKKLPLLINVKGGSSVIEVDTLPTENIDSNSVYKLKEFNNVMINDGASIEPLANMIGISGYEIFETKPTDNIIESNLSGFPMIAHLYYILEENDVFVYTNIGTGATWVSLGMLFAQIVEVPFDFKGECLKKEEANEIGYYVYFDIRYYGTINNTLKEIGEVNSLFQRLLDYEKFTYRLELNYSNVILNKWFQHLDCDYIKIDFIGDFLGGSTPNNTTRIAEVNYETFFNCLAKTIYLTSSKSGTSFGVTGDGAFRQCYYLENLILDFEVLEAFDYSKYKLEIEETTIIYVRDNLVDTVKSLTGWSNYSSQIKPLSEYVD